MIRIWMTGQRIIGWATEQVVEGPGLFRQRKDDRGAEILQTAVIIGLFVAAAIIIVGVIVAKAKSTADNIQTQ